LTDAFASQVSDRRTVAPEIGVEPQPTSCLSSKLSYIGPLSLRERVPRQGRVRVRTCVNPPGTFLAPIHTVPDPHPALPATFSRREKGGSRLKPRDKQDVN